MVPFRQRDRVSLSYQNVWLEVPHLQDRGEDGHRLVGGMCILFLPQIQLAQSTISPCGEASSLNNMDRKCWSVQKMSFRSHSQKNDWGQTRAWMSPHFQWLIVPGLLLEIMAGTAQAVPEPSLCCSCCWSTGKPSSLFSGNHWWYL